MSYGYQSGSVFLAIVETGGFTKAADSLFISQPSLSVSIKRLERKLGVTLFERGGRRAVLTPGGRFFLATAQAMWDDYQFALKGLRDFRSQPTMRLVILRMFRIDDFSEMITTFREQYSKSNLDWESPLCPCGVICLISSM
ncbi:MAG TPA: LysR family transcriptional regulator [Elainellaceae cyanobacterium]